ncbi:MAG: acetylxylan esterase [Planctomycetia bacterium]|nr:acetylxylan esterase [Planctomycetia bacterium]
MTRWLVGLLCFTGISLTFAPAIAAEESLPPLHGKAVLRTLDNLFGAYDPRTESLDATHPQQRNKNHHFAGPLVPDDYTLDPVESPRNSNWFIVVLAARRGITFLKQQPEVDPERIGVYGLSMGGKLTTNVAAIDKRVKAAVPSCGGGGVILERPPTFPAA